MQAINHQQAQEYLHMRQSELSEAEQQALQAHLSGCAECREYAASLEILQGKLRTAFHSRWDGIQPVKSRTGGVLIRLGWEIKRIRLSTFAGTLIGVIALIILVFGLDFVLSNLKPGPAIVPILPTGTSTFHPTIPPPTGVITPTNTLIPSATPLPEGTIVLNWGYSIVPPDAESIASGESWAQGLNAATGLNVVALPGPTTDMELLEALRDGRIHMAELNALAFSYGQALGWIVPGPVLKYTYQPSGSIMFVARKDTGLVPGDPPQVFQQLAGKRPCWPDPEGAYQQNPPVKEYFLPAGLLAQVGVKLGLPVFITHTSTGHHESEAVFLRECDFAVMEAEPVEDFLKYMYDYLLNRGVSFTEWKEQMQVLYTTQPLEPFYIMAFSSQLDSTKRELLTNALLSGPAVQGHYGVHGWLPYDEKQSAFYDQFQALVDASGVDVADYLSRVWDQYLQGLINAALTPSPVPTPTNPPSTHTLTICQGAEPDTLDVNNANMLAANNILEAIYDGPIDSTGFSYQPVILEKLPNLADGDAAIQPVAVKENDFVVNDAGEVVLLRPGEVVRPYGCNLSDCAITWQGGALEMAQMSASFTLKDDIRWSDGEPLTADDSVFGFEMATNCRIPDDPNLTCGSLGAGGHRTAASTASYTSLDERTTQWVGLPGFLDQTYMTNFAHPLPRHQAQGYTPQQFLDVEARKPLGWGPYSIDKWQPGEYISMSKNPYYFRTNEGLPHFDRLTFRFFGGDENSLVSAIQNGACDVLDQEAAQTISLARLIELDSIGQVKALISTGTTWEHVDFNIQPAKSILNRGAFAGWDLDGNGQGPFGDVRLRQAIAMCLDRHKVVDTLFFGKSVVPDTYLPPNHPLFNAQSTHWQYDPAAAAALLDDIGWKDSDNDPSTPRVAVEVTGVPDGMPLEMNYETTDAPVRQQITQILAQSLAVCGIKVNIALHSASEWFAVGPDGPLYGRKYDLGEFAWKTSVIPPCDLFLSSKIPGAGNNWSGQNTPGFANPAFDDACNLQMQSLPGEDTFIEGALEAQRIFAEQLPVVPLFLVLKTAAARPDMCGYSLDPTSSSDFWNIEAFDYGEVCR
jgi:peptide/nickel transport system substrate-binding protein